MTVVIRVGLGISQKDQRLTGEEFDDKNLHNAVAMVVVVVPSSKTWCPKNSNGTGSGTKKKKK